VLRDRHSQAVLRLAEQASQQQCGPEQSAWLDRLELEHANIRAALEYCLAAPAAADRGLAIGASLFLFWSTRAVGEGRRWLGLLLQAGTGATPARARALAVNGAKRNIRPLTGESMSIFILILRSRACMDITDGVIAWDLLGPGRAIWIAVRSSCQKPP
jgi:non-specific serine/threonine protein kinase